VARNINKQGENENSQMQWLAKGAERLETAFHRNCCGSIDKWWKNKSIFFLGEKEGLSQWL